MNPSSSQHYTSSIISYASATCSWVVVQCTESAPFPGWPFGTIFRIGYWTLPWQRIRSSVARFLSHSVYQLSVYLALKGACLPTAFQVENYSFYWTQAPNPHTNQHQPPPDSTKSTIAVVCVLTADLSGLSVLSTFSPQEAHEKLSYRTRIHDLSSLWHLRFTNSLSNGSCLCEHLSRLNSANGSSERIQPPSTSLGSSLTASFVLLDSSFSRVERVVDIVSVFRIRSTPTSVIEIPYPHLPPKSCCCCRHNQHKARRVFSFDFLSQAIKMASSSKQREPLTRKYQDPVEELYALVGKYDEARKRQRLVSKDQDTDVLQANVAYQTTNTSKAHGKCCFLSFLFVV